MAASNGVRVRRYYNSRSSMWGTFGDASFGWSRDTSPDVRLEVSNGGASVKAIGPSGFAVDFARNASGSYKADGATNLGWTLSSTSTGFTLTESATAEQWRFDSAGELKQRVPQSGNGATYAIQQLTGFPDARVRIALKSVTGADGAWWRPLYESHGWMTVLAKYPDTGPDRYGHNTFSGTPAYGQLTSSRADEAGPLLDVLLLRDSRMRRRNDGLH